MSKKQSKQFGIWMDSHHAIIAGKQNTEEGEFMIIDHVNNKGAAGNSNENASNNQEVALTQKFFKEILVNMPNIDEVHVTGTGQIQEQFIKFLAGTPQYKNVVATESTSNKMSDEQLISFIKARFN